MNRPSCNRLALLGATVPLLLAGGAGAARGETDGTEKIQGFYENRYHYHPSPKHWMLELKFGPYKPNVDAEPGLSGKPYDEVFGCGPDTQDCST